MPPEKATHDHTASMSVSKSPCSSAVEFVQPGPNTEEILAEGGRRKHGGCKWFNVAQGWGFITPDDKSQDVFVHQSVIHKSGFRSLADGERVEFEWRVSEKGIEATFVCGPDGRECRGSDRRPVSRKKFRKIRCYNCGDLGNHIAKKCPHGPLPKRCHFCKSTEHLIADCPFREPNRKGKNGSRNGNNIGESDDNEIEEDPMVAVAPE